MDSKTGKTLSGIDHLRQSVRDVLSTPVGSRVMRREYGSRLSELVDHPLNPETRVELYAATAEALDRWEPRLLLERVRASEVVPGRVTLDLEGVYPPTREPIRLENLEIR